MTTLPPYKGFQASVEYDDGVLLISILHINDSVSDTCNEASEALSTFHDLVDDYIQTCAELGEEPNKPFKGSFNVRIGPTLHRNAAMMAASRQLTLNMWVADAIREKLQRDTPAEAYLIRDLDFRTTVESRQEQDQKWIPETAEARKEADVVEIDKYRNLAEQKKIIGTQ
jgi:predicted HicB family RNase H-like nuclease